MGWRLVLLLAINVSLIATIKTAADDRTPPEQALEKAMEDEVESKIKSTCDTLPSTIKVTKEEHDHLGNVIRVCEGSIVVNKCEGTCLSQLKPSVTTATGFLKVLKTCLCCRETFMKPKEIHLTDCFDLDGKRLSETMTVSMMEPEECSCHKCGE